jgi:hypothetical protein
VRGEGARLSPAIGDALARATQIFVAPLTRANERLEALRQRQREGDDVRAIADAVAAIEADLQPFVERFQLGGDTGGPRPLGLRDALGRGDARGAGEAPPARANGVLLLAAALDGRHEVESLAGAATLPALSGAPAAARAPRRCSRRPRRSWPTAASRRCARARTRRCASCCRRPDGNGPARSASAGC